MALAMAGALGMGPVLRQNRVRLAWRGVRALPADPGAALRST